MKFFARISPWQGGVRITRLHFTRECVRLNHSNCTGVLIETTREELPDWLSNGLEECAMCSPLVKINFARPKAQVHA